MTGACTTVPRLAVLFCVAVGGWATTAATTFAVAQGTAADASPAVARSSFAVVGSAIDREDRATASLLRVIDGTAVDFVVHFDLSTPSPVSCSDATIERRRALLDASTKPAVPVAGASQWAACGSGASDPLERIDRVGDVLYGADQSLGQRRLSWSRQSAIPRFQRYRENLRWQVGRVLFATVNLPDNNNNFQVAAGRNGEFEERLVANRAWLERTFRLANERRLAGVVLFVDAAPRFGAPMRVPDSRTRERDGYYEWKLALREVVTAFKGQVLLIQARSGAVVPVAGVADHPLRDAAGHAVERFVRVAIAEATGELRWLRVDVDPTDAKLFRTTVERSFDDPSGELYGPPRSGVPLSDRTTPAAAPIRPVRRSAP